MQTIVHTARFLLLLFIARRFSQGLYQTNNIPLSSQGLWSSELTERLKSHSCHPGPVHEDITLLHGLKSGTFTELGRVKDVEVCVLQCCESQRCELALFTNNLCYGLTCYSSQHCKTVPALGDTHKMTAIFLHKTATVNTTSHINQSTENKQSRTKNSSEKTSRKLVFYPVDSNEGKDLAFSVNLRKIARHYADSEEMKRVLTAKADEHLKRGESAEHENVKEGKDGEEDDDDDDDEKINGSSKLDQFFSRDQVSSTQKYEPSSRRKHQVSIPHQKNNDVNNVEWNSRLLKAAISSSSVAVLIVVLVLLAMSRKKDDKDRTMKQLSER